MLVFCFNLNYLKGLINLNIIYKPRNSGKTTDLIKISAEKNIPILCFSSSISSYIISLAKELNLRIPKPIALHDYANHVVDNVIIDDAEYVLQCLLNSNIEAMGITREV